MIPDQCNYTFCKIKNSQLIHFIRINSWHHNNAFFLSLIVLEIVGLICMRPAVLFFDILKWLICLITYGNINLFEEKSKRERFVSLTLNTPFFFLYLYLQWVTHLCFLVVFTFLFLIPCLLLIFEITPKLLFISRMPTDGELEMANAYTKWLMPTRTPATPPKTARNSTLAVLKWVIWKWIIFIPGRTNVQYWHWVAPLSLVHWLMIHLN